MPSETPRILLVDDDLTLLRLLMQLMEQSGLKADCVTAASGAIGWREFQRADFTLVITDLNMPGGDGRVLIDRIRTISRVPIIITTAMEEDTLRYLCIDEIVNMAVLRKPFRAAAARDLICEGLCGGFGDATEQDDEHDVLIRPTA